MRLLAGILGILLLLLQYSLWLGDDSVIELYRLKRSIAHQSEENAQLAEHNARLEAEVRDLKDGMEAIEERARRELGMIGEHETFFQIVEEEPRGGSSD